MKLGKKKMVIIAFLIIYYVGLTWALFSWQGTVNVDITADTSFHVSNSEGTLELNTPYAESVTSTGWHSFTYRIYNDGNTDIEIAMSVTDNLPANATASWDKTFPLTVAMGAYQPITLTINAAKAGSGSYQWTLTSSVTP